ncbi:MAG: gluconate 2-dehydrogenase subunit 3 family protein [Gammaproteobacteria bacterium]
MPKKGKHLNPPGEQDNSRRSFLLSSGGLLSSVWIAAQWPAITAAAHHADDASAVPAPQGFEFLAAGETADVDAIAAQIVPSGTTPGAREAHAVYFIDRAMATFFSAWAADFRSGLGEFQTTFRASHRPAASFAQAASDEQIAYLKTVDRTPFFETMRILTVLGMFSSPKYGGNFRGIGWTMMGFADQHAFTPPFGYYDREYTGFVPYPAEKHS